MKLTIFSFQKTIRLQNLELSRLESDFHILQNKVRIVFAL